MGPDEFHAQQASSSDSGEHEPGNVTKLSYPDDSAGVTVPTEPPPRVNVSTSTKKKHKRGNARRTGQNLVVRGMRRDPPDVHKLAQVLASLAADLVEEETGDTDTKAAEIGADHETPRRAA